MGERLARAEEWIEGHEKRCEERQLSMGREIRDMKGNISGLTKGAWGVVIAVLGFALVQIYSDLKEQPAPAAVAIAAPAPAHP